MASGLPYNRPGFGKSKPPLENPQIAPRPVSDAGNGILSGTDRPNQGVLHPCWSILWIVSPKARYRIANISHTEKHRKSEKLFDSMCWMVFNRDTKNNKAMSEPKVISIYCDHVFSDRLKARAAAQGRSVSRHVRWLIEEDIGIPHPNVVNRASAPREEDIPRE